MVAFPLARMRRTPGRILIVRNDRLGDVLLTTPVARALRAHFPAARLSWLARPYAAPLLERNPDVDQVLLDQGGPAGELARLLAPERFDVALLVSMDLRLCRAAWGAGIPVRIGPLSSAWGLLLTRPVRQRRARGDQHEADHNLKLLAPLGVPFRRVPTRLELSDAERARGRELLVSLGCEPGGRPLVGVHPGGGGSAPRWPPEHFRELARRLVGAGAAVLVSAGAGEDFAGPGRAAHDPVFLPPDSLTLRELAGVLAAADLVVSNSTGPLHMAVALGVPTLSVYPGAGAGQAFRWGPYPAYPEGDPAHRVFVAPARPDGTSDLAAVPVEALWAECRKRFAGRLAGDALV